jgi:hypothetical protein
VRSAREFFPHGGDRDGPGDHWVTINGNHVLIHESQGGQPAQPQPLTSVVVLGRKLVLTYDARLSTDEKLEASKALTAAADLLNKNADKLTGDEKKAIDQISAISVVSSGTKLGTTGNRTMSTSPKYIRDSSAAWLGSLFGHEGQHYLNAGNYSGENRWKDEQSAGRIQLAIGEKIGFTPAETAYLRNYIDDKNRARMQEHMEKGFTY